MGSHFVPEELKQLHQSLAEALSACDYQTDKRPYAPHVTLMRKLNNPGEIEVFDDINWNVKNFVLVESVSVEDGVQYLVIKKYNFI